MQEVETNKINTPSRIAFEIKNNERNGIECLDTSETVDGAIQETFDV